MATVVSTPVKGWLATLNAGAIISAGNALTCSVVVSGVWEVQVPVGVRYSSNVSLATLVNVYPSSDGGTTFDTVPLTAMAIPTLASGRQVASIRLTTGVYYVAFISSSPVPTCFILTQEVITAVNNV